MNTPCKECHRPIRWCLSSNGKRMPIDPVPVPDGNVIIDGSLRDERTGQEYPRALVLGKADQPKDDVERFVAHFATCPNRRKL